jgi:hypothetical protein
MSRGIPLLKNCSGKHPSGNPFLQTASQVTVKTNKNSKSELHLALLHNTFSFWCKSTFFLSQI